MNLNRVFHLFSTPGKTLEKQWNSTFHSLLKGVEVEEIPPPGMR